jgi:hypothetical protein
MVEKVIKAHLVEIENFTTDVSQKEEGTNKLEVHFNPETLKVTYANQNTGGEQPNGASSQNVGNLTSKLSVELLFDTTTSETANDTAQESDVRALTKRVVQFLKPKENGNSNSEDQAERAPPRTRFQWGSFIFEGVVDSVNETLEYFSAEGMPLRASVSLSMKSDNAAILIDKLQSNRNGSNRVPGGTGQTTPLSQTRPGDTLQRLAGRAGRSADWKSIAAANGIDDPLRPSTGSLLNLKIPRL